MFLSAFFLTYLQFILVSDVISCKGYAWMHQALYYTYI